MAALDFDRSPVKARPCARGWLHEIEHDGFRILARRDSAGAADDPRRIVKVKNPRAPAVKREAEEDWGKR